MASASNTKLTAAVLDVVDTIDLHGPMTRSRAVFGRGCNAAAFDGAVRHGLIVMTEGCKYALTKAGVAVAEEKNK